MRRPSWLVVEFEAARLGAEPCGVPAGFPLGTPDSGTATRPAGRAEEAAATLADSAEGRWNGDAEGTGTGLALAVGPSCGALPPSCAARRGQLRCCAHTQKLLAPLHTAWVLMPKSSSGALPNVCLTVRVQDG